MKSPLAFLILATISLVSSQPYVNITWLPSSTIRTASGCRGCRFRLCNLEAGGDFIPAPVGLALSIVNISAEPLFICTSRGPTIGHVLRVKTALVRSGNDGFIPIERFGSRSLEPQFTSDFFRVKRVDLPGLLRVSTIRRSRFLGTDQRNLLEGRCIFFPFNTWEVVNGDDDVQSVETASASDEKSCLSFVSTSEPTQIKIQFTWNTAFDLDLAVQEPSGNAINFGHRRSPNGGCLFDGVSQGSCIADGAARDSMEIIEYSGLASPEVGRYTVELAVFSGCRNVLTAWELTITIRGVIVMKNEGTLPRRRKNRQRTFESVSFTFPSGEIVDRE